VMTADDVVLAVVVVHALFILAVMCEVADA